MNSFSKQSCFLATNYIWIEISDSIKISNIINNIGPDLCYNNESIFGSKMSKRFHHRK